MTLAGIRIVLVEVYQARTCVHKCKIVSKGSWMICDCLAYDWDGNHRNYAHYECTRLWNKATFQHQQGFVEDVEWLPPNGDRVKMNRLDRL